jgi:hypothetical protein
MKPQFKLALEFTDNPAESRDNDPSSPKILKPIPFDEECNIHDDIKLTLLFSDNRTVIMHVKTGDTVQNIKKKLEDQHGIPYAKMAFMLDGKIMLDPLSLNDYPQIGNGKCEQVTIHVHLRE